MRVGKEKFSIAIPVRIEHIYFIGVGSERVEEELQGAKQRLGWPLEPRFPIPEDVQAHFCQAGERGMAISVAVPVGRGGIDVYMGTLEKQERLGRATGSGAGGLRIMTKE